jgi:hypothetical protein
MQNTTNIVFLVKKAISTSKVCITFIQQCRRIKVSKRLKKSIMNENENECLAIIIYICIAFYSLYESSTGHHNG